MEYERKIYENLKLSEEEYENNHFSDCTFIKCHFESMKLAHCSFSDCKFIHCNIVNLSTKYTHVKNTEFEDCNLIGIHWHKLVPPGKIKDPISTLTNCYLKYNSFIHMGFIRFQFTGNNIENSMFEECNLKDGSFKSDSLMSTQFVNCDLQGADFRDAMGYQINIHTNKLKGAKFSFPEVVSLLSVLDIKID